MTTRLDIQVLRGIAVIAVVAFHLSEKFFPYGYLGVDVFFVISGYVLANQFRKIFQGDKIKIFTKLLGFYRTRFWRLTPALFVMLSGSTVLIFLVGVPSSHSSFSLQGIATVFLVGNFSALKLNGDYFRPDPNPLVHTWSLSVEEQIYILLPIVLTFMFYIFQFTQKKFFLIVFSLTTISFIINLNPNMAYPLYSFLSPEQDFSTVSFYSPFERFWQFGAGILTKAIEREGCKNKFLLKSSVCIIFIAILAFGGFKASSLEIFASFVTAFIIYSKILSHQSNKILMVLTWVGDRSYSIYLVHLPLFYVTKFSPIMSSEKSIRRLLLLIAFMLTILLGSLLYSSIEQKFRLNSNLFDNDLKPLRKESLGIFLLCPLLLFSMLVGSNNRYFGLDKNPPVPLAEWDLAHECNSPLAKQKLCKIINKEGAKVVMLLGDSHAAHLKISFLEAARKNGLNAVLSTNIGCRFYLNKLSERDAIDPCLIENLQNLDYIKNNQVDYVIISQKVLSTSPLNMLSEAIIDLKKYVKSVGIISNTPEFPNNPFNEPIIYQIIDRSWQPQNSFRINQLPSVNKVASDKFVNLLGDRVKTLDLFSVFCDGQVCSRVRDDKYLYMDENHLSVEGAQLALPKLSSFIADLALQ